MKHPILTYVIGGTLLLSLVGGLSIFDYSPKKVEVGDQICLSGVQYTINQDVVTGKTYIVADVDADFDLIICNE